MTKNGRENQYHKKILLSSYLFLLSMFTFKRVEEQRDILNTIENRRGKLLGHLLRNDEGDNRGNDWRKESETVNGFR